MSCPTGSIRRVVPPATSLTLCLPPLALLDLRAVAAVFEVLIDLFLTDPRYGTNRPEDTNQHRGPGDPIEHLPMIPDASNTVGATCAETA